jgi:uncharacterized protein (DUF2252 family)
LHIAWTFKGDNRLAYFDLNDFDEAALAPCTWELARFCTSVLVAAKTLDLSRPDAVQLCRQFLDAYSQALQTGKARWVERETAEGMVQDLLDGLQQRKRAEFLDKRTELEQGKRRFRGNEKHLFPLTAEQTQQLRRFLEQFASRQINPGFFKYLDVAGRIAGLGSLGIERYAILVEGKGSPDRNYLLDLKQAPGSSLQPYLQWPQPAWPTPAERVVAVQRRVQAVSPAFLHAVTLDGKAFVLKALQPQEDRLELERWKGHLQRLETVLVTMGQIVAWGQLRSAGRQGSAIADEWIAFETRKDWQAPLLDYAQAYSKQVQEDWKLFQEAFEKGRLESQ